MVAALSPVQVSEPVDARVLLAGVSWSTYVALRVKEVRLWQTRTRRLDVHVLTGKSYRARTKSDLLRGLDITEIASFMRLGESDTALAKAYRAILTR